MKSFQIFKKSLRQLTEFKNMILLLYTVELIMAVILIIPLYNQFNQFVGHSLLGRELLQGFEMTVFTEWANHWAEGAHTQFNFILLVGLTYLVVSIFLQGGILGTIIRDEEVSFYNQFFGNAGHYFGRFFRLFLLMIPFVFIVLAINAALGALFKWISGDVESLRFILLFIKLLMTILIFLFVKMVFDYAKVQTVFRERIKMLKTIFQAFSFVLRNLGKTLSLYYQIAILSLILFVVQTLLNKWIHPSTAGIIFLFIWFQIFYIARMAVRVLLFTAQATLYKKYVEPDYENIL